MKKCKEGHYYCYQDSKCKPIPKGFRRGVGGYLRREREDEKEDSKKNGNGNGKSNGSSNGNGNGGNGSGNGNGGNGGNGGGNGSGGVGESVEIQNSDGETTALVVDIIGPAHMKPAIDGNGVWKGTNIKESSVALPFFLKTINKTNALKKTIPLVTTGIGALGSFLQARKNRGISKRKAKFLEKQLKDTPTQRTGGETFDTSGLDTDKITPNEIKPKRIISRKGEVVQDEYIPERKMTEKEKRKDDRLKKKYDKSDMKKNMQKQYGKEEGKKVYFATIRKQAMGEEKKKDHEPEMIRSQLKTAKRASKRIKKHTLKKDNFKAWVQSIITKASDYLDTAADYLDSKDDVKEGKDPKLSKIVKQLRKSVKSHGKQADYIEKVNKKKDVKEESNPRIPRKKGQPANSKKHSDLYTDENPKGTIHGLGFKDVATAKASVAKIRKSNRSHAHKIQAAVAMEQRAREMGKTSEAAVYRKFINSMKKKTKK